MLGKSPKIDVAEFDVLARAQLSPAEFETLQQCTLAVGSDPTESEGKPPVQVAIIRFEQYLRTRIAKRRSMQEDDQVAQLPDPIEYFGEVDLGIAQVASAPDPAERERIIDQIRWRHLDDLETGHDFDLEQLCIYRVRLCILDKYRHRDATNGRKIFDAAVDRISADATANMQKISSMSQELE